MKKNDSILRAKAEVLINYLSKTPKDQFIPEEQIINDNPDWFSWKKSDGGTTLDRSLNDVLHFINKHEDINAIIVNNHKRAYKLANCEEAKLYRDNLKMKGIKCLARAWNVNKKIRMDGQHDLLLDKIREYLQ